MLLRVETRETWIYSQYRSETWTAHAIAGLKVQCGWAERTKSSHLGSRPSASGIQDDSADAIVLESVESV